MLASDTHSTHDTPTLLELLKGTHDVAEIESLYSKWAKNETLVEFPMAQLRNKKTMTFLSSYIIRMCYFNGKIK